MKFFACVILTIGIHLSYAQKVTVRIDPTIQRTIGGSGVLDRSKYFKIHNSSEDSLYQAFSQDYEASNGRGFWGPFSYAKSKTNAVGTYPAYKTGGTELRAVKSGFVATEHPANVARYTSVDNTEAANWAVEYFKDFVDSNGRAEYFEPMNEPFVHAGDEVYRAEQPDEQLMRRKMAEIYGAIGQAFDNSAELANMKVIGYSSAWPSMELWDFDHWDTRMKMFMDVAGDHMDAFSTHLYDGINVTGQNTRRSGSNSEAILDLIESYSYQKWGTVKPHAITEYGGIEKGYPSGYSDVKSIQSIKSINHILFNLLEREDRLLLSIPFITGTATWHITEANNYEPYGAVLWRPKTITPTSDPNKPELSDWTYTARIRFFQLWNGVNGQRVFIRSSNPDIQTQAFLDGTNLYVALNNLDDYGQTVDLELASGLPDVSQVAVRSLKIYDQKDPIYQETSYTSAPSSIGLIPGETAIIKYSLASTPTFENSITTSTYYADSILQPITADQAIEFSFYGVATGFGDGTLRMSIGRKHDKSKAPEVYVNDTLVKVPDNWKGYDQSNRDDFFGTIDIPIPATYLSDTTSVRLRFADTGGHVSSLVLTVNQCTSNCDLKVNANQCGENAYSGSWTTPLMNDQQLVVQSDYSLNQDLSTCNLTIKPGAKLTVLEGSTLEINGTLSLEKAQNNVYPVGNMDSGEPGWKEWGSWNGTSSPPRNFTSAAAHTGTYGLEVPFDDNGASAWSYETSAAHMFELTAGTNYTVSFYVKCTSSIAKNIDFRLVADGWTSTSGASSYVVSENWTQHTLSYTPTETKNHKVYMNFNNNKSATGNGVNATSFYIDDVEVIDPNLPATDGQLVVNSGASLLMHELYENESEVTINRTTRYADGRYSLVGTPVQANSSTTGADLGPTVYSYNEAIAYGASGLSRWEDASDKILEPGIGYAQAFQQNLIFTGKPNLGTVVSSTTYTESGTEASHYGWNLVSNPYPAAISATAFVDANLTNTTGAVYLWDDPNSELERGTNSDYFVVNNTGAVGSAPNGGQWNEHIGATQGFFVKLASPSADATVNFYETMRVSGYNADTSYFRKGASEAINLRLALSSKALDSFNETLIGLRDQATLDADHGFDADKFSASGLQLYSLIDQMKYAIQALPVASGVSTELGFDLPESGELTLQVTELTGLKEGHTFILTDKLTGKSFDLSENNSITFQATAGSDQNRFTLIYGLVNVLSNKPVSAEPLYRYLNGTLSVDFQEALEVSEYAAYDLSGQLITRAEGITGTTNHLDIPLSSKGITIVKIATSKGLFTRKFIF